MPIHVDPEKVEVKIDAAQFAATVSIRRVDGKPLTVLDIVNGCANVAHEIATSMSAASKAGESTLPFQSGHKAPFMDKAEVSETK